MDKKVFNSQWLCIFCFILSGVGAAAKKKKKCDGSPFARLSPSVCTAKASWHPGRCHGISGWLTQVILEIPHDMLLSVQPPPCFSVIFRQESIYSNLSWSKAWKSEIVEFIKEIAYQEENQLFTIIATGVFPRNSDFVYSSAHGVSVSVADSLMDLNWNDVQHRRGRNKCRNLGSNAAGCLLVARIWRLTNGVVQDTVRVTEGEPWKGFGDSCPDWTQQKSFTGVLQRCVLAVNTLWGSGMFLKSEQC